jgi:Ca2+-binding EF-hand superfamily protein
LIGILDERYLVKNILPEVEDEELHGFAKYEKFEKVMLRILDSNEFEPDSGDVILQAFRTLDKENKGYVTVSEMEQSLQEGTGGFKTQELKSFLDIAQDKQSENIYYEDYVALLVSQIQSLKSV